MISDYLYPFLLLFFPQPYPKVRMSVNFPYFELYLTEAAEEQEALRIKIIPNSQPDRPHRAINSRYYYSQSPQLLTRDLWYPSQQEHGARFSIKLDRIPPQYNYRLDCDGSFNRWRGGYGFVLRDAGYNPLFGGFGKSASAVDSFYHELEAIWKGLYAVINKGFTNKILIYSDNKEAILLIRRFGDLNDNERNNLGLGDHIYSLLNDISFLLRDRMMPGGYELRYHYREGNFIADYLSKKGNDVVTQHLISEEQFYEDDTLDYFVNRDRGTLNPGTAKPYLRYHQEILPWLRR